MKMVSLSSRALLGAQVKILSLSSRALLGAQVKIVSLSSRALLGAQVKIVSLSPRALTGAQVKMVSLSSRAFRYYDYQYWRSESFLGNLRTCSTGAENAAPTRAAISTMLWRRSCMTSSRIAVSVSSLLVKLLWCDILPHFSGPFYTQGLCVIYGMQVVKISSVTYCRDCLHPIPRFLDLS